MKKLTINRKKTIIISLLCIIFLPNFYLQADNKAQLSTYFQYHKKDLRPVKKLSTPLLMSSSQLQKWDIIMFNLVTRNKLSGIPAARIYAYVYVGQRDAAVLSKDIKGEFAGSLEPVSSKVLCLFFSKDCKALEKKVPHDHYSNLLANIVVEKIKKRIELDQQQMRVYPQRLKGNNYWSGKIPFVGQDTGSALPWLISSPKAFLPPAPPIPQANEWQRQLQQVKIALHHMSSDQRKSLLSWVGDPSSITLSGVWLNYANQYMAAHREPLVKRLLVRSVLAMGLVDSFTAAFHAKYTYWVKRPNMLDPSLVAVIPTPNHPSYPAGHACISATAASILSYYFPEKKQKWWSMADTAGQGRVIAGVHFPIDIQQGQSMGDKIGRSAVLSTARQ